MKWKRLAFANVFSDVTSGNVKLPTGEYKLTGLIPIIDQGAEFIAGFTDKKECCVKRDRPVIIFGDHTKVLKYVDFDFCLGADGVKVLQPIINCCEKYLFYFLRTVKLPNLGYNRHFKYLKEIDIPLPPLHIQKQIADTLDKADALRRKDQELLKKYDELAQSIFYDMFGDLADGRFKDVPLIDLADVTSGITKNSKQTTSDDVEVPYLRVANVQDGFLDLREIKTIRAPLAEVLKYDLKKGDVVITEGGDPDKLGRGCVWNDEVKGCSFQNHIFRIRVLQPVITPFFLSKVLGSAYGKSYFLKAAKQTTGIASINSKQLKSFPVKVPPLKLQTDYESTVMRITDLKRSGLKSTRVSSLLFESLLTRFYQ